MILRLESYAKTEDAKVEELIKAVADSSAKVIVSGAAIGEMAMHFCERYKCVLNPSLFSHCILSCVFYLLLADV